MYKQLPTRQLTLYDAAIGYVVYLHAVRLPFIALQSHVRVIRHVLTFYGKNFPLSDFSGKRMLQYADLFDPFSPDPYDRERGQVFWKFASWMKKNELVPAWTAPEPKY